MTAPNFPNLEICNHGIIKNCCAACYEAEQSLNAARLLGCPFCGEVPTLPATDKLVCCTNNNCPIYGRHMPAKTWNARPSGHPNVEAHRLPPSETLKAPKP